MAELEFKDVSFRYDGAQVDTGRVHGGQGRLGLEKRMRMRQKRRKGWCLMRWLKKDGRIFLTKVEEREPPIDSGKLGGTK